MNKVISILLAGCLMAGSSAFAEELIKTHAYALVGQPMYKKGFTHFTYVNPDAPKGGTLKRSAFGSFDSFNLFAIKGRAAVGAGYIYDSLLVPSHDEPSAYYGLIAESMEYAKDFSRVIFNIRKNARFHDGNPITAEDVVFSFYQITKVSPFYKNYFKLVKEVKALGPHRVEFIFKKGANKEMPLIAGQLTIIPKHYWEDKDLSRSTLEIPLGSGPYRIESFDSGKRVVLARVKDYWAKDLPVNKGQYNFDKIIFEYFKDHTVSFEAFKAGLYDIRGEAAGKRWHEGYTGKNFDKNLITKAEIMHKRPAGMAGIVMNTSVCPLTDINVRKALILAYDYEWLNKNFYYDEEIRHTSFFSNSELACSGLPKGKELEILMSVKDSLDKDIFVTPPKLPKTTGHGLNRENLKKAVNLLKKHGYRYKNGFMVDSSGKKLETEILIASKSLEKDLLLFQERLKHIGIGLKIKFMDSTQYVEKIRSHDFMMVYTRVMQSFSPGNEQRNMWHSLSAHEKGSKNYASLENSAVDKIVDIIIKAKDRETLVAASRALDRVLLSLAIVIPDGYSNRYRIAYWNKFGRPDNPPKYSLSFNSWWIDKDKEQSINSQLNLFDSK